jgi:hypothetical protein
MPGRGGRPPIAQVPAAGQEIAVTPLALVPASAGSPVTGVAACHVPRVAVTTKAVVPGPAVVAPPATQARPRALRAVVVRCGAQDTARFQPMTGPETLSAFVMPLSGCALPHVPLTSSATNACPVNVPSVVR